MERMRERANRGPSFVNQMLSEGRGQRNWYVIKDKTGKILDSMDSQSSYVEIDGKTVITQPIYDMGLFGLGHAKGERRASSAFSLDNVTVEGDIRRVK